MGEMIKFGIKVGLTIAIAIAIVAAIAILFDYLNGFNLVFPSNSGLSELLSLVSLIFPIRLNLIFSAFAVIFACKVAYWAADKMLWLVEALS